MGMARKVDLATGFFESTFGHTLYKAPEIADSKFSWRSDMWAVGCVLLELLSHSTMMELYSNQRLVLGVLTQADLAARISSILPGLEGTSVWRLVNRLVVRDYNLRLTAAQVVQWDLAAS